MEAKELMIGFKYISQYEGLYSIDRAGAVFSHASGKLLKPYPNHRGYLMVQLYKDGKGRRINVHRLVAQTYIPNPDNLPEVDHIDTNRQNNKVENLRWCTRKENCNNPLSLIHSGESKRGDKHYLYGKKLSVETRRKMSESHMGHPTSEGTRRKIGNANRGRIMSEEQKLALSLSRKGRNVGIDNANARSVKQYTKDMTFLKEWDSISDASRELGISVSSISNNLKGLSKSAGGFIWQ